MRWDVGVYRFNFSFHLSSIQLNFFQRDNLSAAFFHGKTIVRMIILSPIKQKIYSHPHISISLYIDVPYKDVTQTFTFQIDAILINGFDKYKFEFDDGRSKE